MASDKRERQPNWAPREEILFVTAYIERADIIEGEFSGCGVGSSRGISHATKEEAWNAIREIVNSNSANLRTIEQFKKKIAQIKCLALRKNRKNHTETGGGKGFIITEAEQLYLDFLKNSNSTTLSGINTSTDIGFSSEIIPPNLETNRSNLSYFSTLDRDSSDIFSIFSKKQDSEATETCSAVAGITNIEDTHETVTHTAFKSGTPGKRKKVNHYEEFLKESIKVLKLKQRKLELELKA